MIFHKTTCLWVLYASLIHLAVARGFGNFNGNFNSSSTTSVAVSASTGSSNFANNNGGTSSNGNADASLTLDANAVQTGSQSDGQAVLAAGQSPSAT